MTKKLRVIVIEDDVSMGECYRQMINLVSCAEAKVIHDGADGLLANNNDVTSRKFRFNNAIFSHLSRSKVFRTMVLTIRLYPSLRGTER